MRTSFSIGGGGVGGGGDLVGGEGGGGSNNNHVLASAPPPPTRVPSPSNLNPTSTGLPTGNVLGTANCPRARLKVEELFSYWMSQPDTLELIDRIIAGEPLPPPTTAMHLRSPSSPSKSASQACYPLIPPVSAAASVEMRSPTRSPKTLPERWLPPQSINLAGSPSAAAAAVAAAAGGAGGLSASGGGGSPGASPRSPMAMIFQPSFDVSPSKDSDASTATPNKGVVAAGLEEELSVKDIAVPVPSLDDDDGLVINSSPLAPQHHKQQNASPVHELPSSPTLTTTAAATTPVAKGQKATDDIASPVAAIPTLPKLSDGYVFPSPPPAVQEEVVPADPERRQFTEVFNLSPDKRIEMDAFLTVCKEICKFPSFFATPLVLQCTGGASGDVVSLDEYAAYWESHLAGKDPTTRFFNLVSQGRGDCIRADDLRPFLIELLEYHPALEFLKATPDFQDAYVETVIHRVMYDVNRKRDGQISLEEVRESSMMEVFTFVDEETDINEVKHYFSYEHFYVIYCKFWELDENHDKHLTESDLMRYASYSLSSSIIDRIMQRYASGPNQTFTYADFVYFILSEEDKTTDQALDYWFPLIDLDDDGVLSPSELHHFFKEQMERLSCIPHEVIKFEDVLCQMHDMIEPTQKNKFSKMDLRRCRMFGNLFNVLFNINKLLFFEHADPYIGHEDRMAMGVTDWDRYADAEYSRLAAEEEEEDDLGSDAGMNLTHREDAIDERILIS